MHPKAKKDHQGTCRIATAPFSQHLGLCVCLILNQWICDCSIRIDSRLTVHQESTITLSYTFPHSHSKFVFSLQVKLLVIDSITFVSGCYVTTNHRPQLFPIRYNLYTKQYIDRVLLLFHFTLASYDVNIYFKMRFHTKTNFFVIYSLAYLDLIAYL